MPLRHALRSLRNSPGYAAACVAVLALGIGGNTAIFSLIYQAVLKPLPYPDADRLVLAFGGFPALPAPLSTHISPSRLMYDAWRREARSVDAFEAFHEARFRESDVTTPRVLETELVSAGLLPLLGAHTEQGRLFRPAEEAAGADAVAILSDHYFEERFHRAPQAIGARIRFGGAAYTVIGVLRPDFHVPMTFGGENRVRPDVYIPLSRGWTSPAVDGEFLLTVVGKLRSGASIDQARAELAALQTRLHQDDAERFPTGDLYVYSLRREQQSDDLDRALYVLLGAVALVLLIGCANLGNLTLARSARRSREIAVRRALGASRTEVVRQLLTESLLLAGIGALAGLLLARWLVHGLLALAPADLVRPGMGALSVPVFLFAAGIAGLTVLLVGLVPAIAASGADVNAVLRSGGRPGSAGGRRSRGFLIAAEVAMALVLLSGAGLLLRSFVRVIRTDLGFDVDRVLAVDLDLPEAEYPDADARARLLDTVQARTQAMPGVSAATISDTLPLHRVSMTSFEIVGRPPLPPGQFITADSAGVLPGYPEIIGVPLVAGRALTAGDVARSRTGKETVALVNRAFVDKFLAPDDPLAARLTIGGRTVSIVGIVGNFRAFGAERDVRPQFFTPGPDGEFAMLVVKSPAAAAALSADLRSMLGSIDEHLASARIRTLDEYVSQSLELRRFGLALISAFAGVALLLAMVGVHGVLANLVAARTREIGIRMAIGATPAGIARLMAEQTLAPLAAGVTTGLAGSLVLGVVIRSMLFEVRSYDPAALTLAVGALLAVTPLAIWRPIRRATRVDCTAALRDE
jgi:putative ABC transport system permease protein